MARYGRVRFHDKFHDINPMYTKIPIGLPGEVDQTYAGRMRCRMLQVYRTFQRVLSIYQKEWETVSETMRNLDVLNLLLPVEAIEHRT